MCKEHVDCYFKQLKRLQEENEKSKKCCEKWFLETVKMLGAIDGKDFRIDKCKQALEEIRDYCKKCKKCVETGDEVILYTIIKKIDEVIDDRN